MCKLLLMSGIKNVDNARKFINEMATHMSIVDRHGIGYVAIDKDKKLFSEKWLNNDDFGNSYCDNTSDMELKNKLGDFVIDNIDKTYMTCGEINLDNISSFMLHTRFATCEKNIDNTHPFIYNNNLALVHNGIISNHNLTDNIISTCDSEVILNKYHTENVIKNINNIEAVTKQLTGSFAVGVMGYNKGKPYMDVFKNHGSNLYVTYVDEIGCEVFATSNDHLEKTIESLGFSINKIFRVSSNMLLRFDAITGEVIGKSKFTFNMYADSKKNITGIINKQKTIDTTTRKFKNHTNKTYDAITEVNLFGDDYVY